MIYLIKSAGYGSDGGYIDLLKIGYAKRMDKRLPQYMLHNPTCKVLKTLPGSLIDETNLQYKFRKYKYSLYGNEWFVYNQEIVDYFNSSPDFSKLEQHERAGELFQRKMRSTITKLSDRYFLGVHDIFSEPDEEYLTKVDKIRELIGKTIYTVDDLIQGFIETFSIDEEVSKKVFKDTTGIKEVDEILKKFNSIRKFPERLKLVCNTDFSSDLQWKLLQKLPLIFSKCFYILGPERCKANSYRQALVFDEIKVNVDNLEVEDDVAKKIYENFIVGERYKKVEIKEKLRSLYSELGYNKTPKATDLEEYFEMKPCKITDDSGEIIGFKLLNRRLL